MILNRIKHPQVRATSRSINNARVATTNAKTTDDYWDKNLAGIAGRQINTKTTHKPDLKLSMCFLRQVSQRKHGLLWPRQTQWGRVGTKEQVTALITTRADGTAMPTAIVYPYKRAVQNHSLIRFRRTLWWRGPSLRGWLPKFFNEYLANCFIPQLNETRRQEKIFNHQNP